MRGDPIIGRPRWIPQALTAWTIPFRAPPPSLPRPFHLLSCLVHLASLRSGPERVCVSASQKATETVWSVCRSESVRAASAGQKFRPARLDNLSVSLLSILTLHIKLSRTTRFAPPPSCYLSPPADFLSSSSICLVDSSLPCLATCNLTPAPIFPLVHHFR